MKNQIFVPYINPKDLSEQSLQKAVFKRTMGSGMFQYPFFAILGIVGLGLIFGFSFWSVVVCILLIGVSSISWVIQMFIKNDGIKLQYIKELKQRAEEEIRKKNRQLSDDLVSFDISDAAIQLRQFENNFKNFVFILDQKFNPNELAYNRYYSIVQQIILAGMNNLQTIFLRKKNLTDADPREIQKTLEKLQKIVEPTAPQQSRIAELEKRLSIYQDENREIDELLAQNEKALTAIDDVSRSIAAINTDTNLSSNMESAMQDLIEMTDFAKVLDSNYSNAIKI